MNRVTHFEIHATEPEKLIAFYRDLFGWQFEAWGPPGYYWIIRTAPDGDTSAGINGGLVPRRGPAPSDGQPVSSFVCTVDVASTKTSLDRAVELGGSIALPIMPIPGAGWLGYAKDPDGNIFGMMQHDPSAA